MIHLGTSRLQTRLMMLIVVAMLPFFGLALYHASQDRDRKLQDLQNEAVRMAELGAGSIGKVIEGTRLTLLFLAHAEPVRAMDVAASNKPNPLTNLGLFQSDSLLVSSALPPNQVISFADRSWFHLMQQTRGFSIGEYQIGKITGKPSLNFAFPLPNQPNGAPVAGVFAALNLDILQECIALPKLPPESVILVVDRNGTYLARNPGYEKLVGTKSLSWATLQARGGSMEGFIEATGADGIRRFYHYEPVPGSDNSLFVAVGISKLAIQTEVRADFLHNLFGLCLFTMLALLCAGMIANRSVLKHVNWLSDASRRLAKGDWDVGHKVVGGAIEFQQLWQSFDSMARALKEQQDHLEEMVLERTNELTGTNQAMKQEIAERMRVEKELKQVVAELRDALAHIQTLRGLLPICSGCKKIRDDHGYWSHIEAYISQHSEAQFSHSLCPDCVQKYYPEYSNELLHEPPQKGDFPV